MNKRHVDNDFKNLPTAVQDFIKLIIKKMRYRKSVRRDVQAELTAHFEDELRGCTDLQQAQQKAKELIEQFGDAKLLGILLRRAKKRCRPLWRTVVVRTFQTVGILFLCLIIYSAWFLTGKPNITVDYLAQLNRLVCPVADESQNAAPFFKKAVAVYPNEPDGRVWPSSYSDANDAERFIIQQWVKQCSKSLKLITEGTKKPHFWREYKTGSGPNDDGSLLGVLIPDLANYRRLARTFGYKTQIQAEQGLYYEAFDSLITCYKFGRLVGQGEKMLVEQLVGISIKALSIINMREILAKYDINSRELAALQADLAEAQVSQEFRMRLLNEKLMVYDEIQRCFTDGFGGGHPYPKRLLSLGQMWENDFKISTLILGALFVPKNWDDAVRFMFLHPNKAETKQQASAFYDFIEETSKMSPAELREKGIDLDKKAESITIGNIFLRILTPALSKIHSLSYRLKTDTGSMPVVIAALRFKAEEQKYPDDLAELKQRGYIKQIPLDSFSDKPLVYRKTDDGFILYSVGLNFIDDDGQVYRDHKDRGRLWDDRGGDSIFWPVQR